MNTQSKTPEESLKGKFEDLIEEYKKENNSKDFLLFDLANANENAHTNVLLWLLSHKGKEERYIFLPSFLQLLDIDYNETDKCVISGQKKAIGNKGTGFIDLYIKVGEKQIIIENKIYGAADTERQIARYVATAQGIAKNEKTGKQENRFNDWYDNKEYKETDYTNIYVIYLTSDGQKEPDESSLPTELKEQLKNNYIPLNYDADILPWLEENVLPNVATIERGILLTGNVEYMEYLRGFLSASKKSKVVKGYIKKYYGEAEFVKFVTDLKNLYKEYSKNKEFKDIANPLFKEIMSASESYFFKNIGNEWCVHVLLTCIILYKKSWRALDKRKYTIPTLHLVASNSKYLNEANIGELDWVLEVDHLKDNCSKDEDEIRYYSNHKKTFRFELKNNFKLNSFVVVNKDDKNVIESIDAISNNTEEITPDLLLDKVYEKSKEWTN